MDSDLMKERREFDDLKIGVKGLSDSGITSIPRFFVQNSEDLSDLKKSSELAEIPTIDLSGVNTDKRKEITEQVSKAAREWGFFQIVNHSIPASSLDAIISAIRWFHEQPQEIKKQHYNREKPVAYVANNDLFRSKAASWRDTLLVSLAKEEPEIDQIPEICRKEVVEWKEHATRVGEILMELLGEGLGLETCRLKEIECASKWILVGQYYPYCPQPELTLGIPTHTDKGVLTVLVQDQIGGLQVKKDGEWVAVKPLAGALVINIGDFLQVISNGEYKSAEHRVLANPHHRSRTSVAVFLSPSEENTGLYGPLTELLSPTKPALYRDFTISEQNQIFTSKELTNIYLPNEFKV
ncbi:hypothetical protein ACHQM5_012836 [Ranunculus cassubicifolius]